MKKSTAETIAYAIKKECQKFSLYDWCDSWDITTDEFEEFLELAVNNAEQQERDRLGQLKEYQQLEEQGKLIKFSCRVGDTVWDNDYGRPCAYTITAFSFGECEEYICEPVTTKEAVFYYTNSSGSITGSFAESEIGKSVFLNKSEAEANMKSEKKETVDNVNQVSLTDEETKKILDTIKIADKNTNEKIWRSYLIPIIIGTCVQLWGIVYPVKKEILDMAAIFMCVWLMIGFFLMLFRSIKRDQALDLLDELTPFCTDDVACKEIGCPFLNTESGECNLGYKVKTNAEDSHE